MQKTSITLVDKELRVRFPFNPIMVNMIRLLDPRRKWRPETKEWAFPAEGPILERLCDAFGVDRYALADDLKALIKPVTLPPPVDLSLVDSHVFLTKPYEHQRRGLAELLTHDRWGLWWEMGCIHAHTPLQCSSSGRVLTVEEWYKAGELPLLAAYDRHGEIATEYPSRIIVKPVTQHLKITLDNGLATTVGENHLFLVSRGGKKCLIKAKELLPADSLATKRTRRAGTSGQESISGTSHTLASSIRNKKHTGLDSFSATAPCTTKVPISNSSSDWPSETPTTCGSSLETLGLLEHPLLFVEKIPNMNAAKCTCSVTNSVKPLSDLAWTHAEKNSGWCRRCRKALATTFGAAYLTPTAPFQSLFALRDLPAILPLPCATLPRTSSKILASNSGCTACVTGEFSADTPPIRFPPEAAARPSGGPTGCTPELRAFWPGRLPFFVALGPREQNLKRVLDEAELTEHYIPASCHNILWRRISKIQQVGSGKVYDLTMPKTANYFDAYGINHQNTGKTYVASNRLKSVTGKTLIICPKSLLKNWKNELALHAGIQARSILDKDREQAQVLVCNYDALASKRNTFIFDIDFEVVIADEVQFLKNSTAQRSKLARRAAQRAKYRWALSGTPAPNSPLDWFGVLLFIDPEAAGTTSKTAFAARYAIMQDIPGGGKMVAGYRDLGDLNRRVASVSSRLTKEECLDLPEKVFVERRCVLTGEQLRVYKDLKDKAVARLNQQKEESTLSVRNILTESLRLLQCVGGFLPSDEGVVHALVPGAKMELLGDVLEEVGPKKLVLWCSFLEELHAVERLLVTLGRKVVTFHGDVAQADRERAVEDFQRGGADVFLATPATGGVGLTLTAADTEVFYSRTWSLTHWLQATDRLHRIGQVNKVTVISLVAEGTVDEKVAEALARKEQTQEYLMRRPVEELL